MWHRLALALGMTVHDAKDRISSSEFSAWIAFWRLEPWGERRGDYQSAQIARVVAAALGQKVDFSDCLLAWPSTPRKRKTVKELAQGFQIFANVHNRIVNNGNNRKS